MARKTTLITVTVLALLGCPREGPSGQVFRAVGTEPFWGLYIDEEGMRFTTPDNLEGMHFPPREPELDGDALVWAVESDQGVLAVGIQPGHCSDMMSDKLWTHHAIVRIDGSTYRGCAEIPIEPSSAHDPLGDWVIVQHRMPGVSAMDYDQAIQWHGRTIHLGIDAAVSGEDVCSHPDYRYQGSEAGEYLREAFRIAPASLGLESVEKFGATEIFCDGEYWNAPGGTLLWADNRPPFAVWDGVFFELRRLGETTSR